jgi:hypothetical protein
MQSLMPYNFESNAADCLMVVLENQTEKHNPSVWNFTLAD